KQANDHAGNANGHRSRVSIPDMSATIRNFLRTCKQQGVVPTRYLLTVNIAKLTTTLWERDNDFLPPFRLVKTLRCSTSKYGIGRPDSHDCVHLSANDLIPLYDKLPEGTLIWIAES